MYFSVHVVRIRPKFRKSRKTKANLSISIKAMKIIRKRWKNEEKLTNSLFSNKNQQFRSKSCKIVPSMSFSNENHEKHPKHDKPRRICTFQYILYDFGRNLEIIKNQGESVQFH